MTNENLKVAITQDSFILLPASVPSSAIQPLA